MSALDLSVREDGVRFSVHVKPRSSRSRVEGVRDDGALVVALKAPPVEGAANLELIALLAQVLGVKKAAVRIVSGHNGRRKTVDVLGTSLNDVLTRVS